MLFLFSLTEKDPMNMITTVASFLCMDMSADPLASKSFGDFTILFIYITTNSSQLTICVFTQMIRKWQWPST